MYCDVSARFEASACGRPWPFGQRDKQYVFFLKRGNPFWPRRLTGFSLQESFMRPDVPPSSAPLERRILCWNGAMGTMIQGYRLAEASMRRAFRRLAARREGQQRPARPHAAADHSRDPLQVPCVRSGHSSENEHFQRQRPSMADYGMEGLVMSSTSRRRSSRGETADRMVRDDTGQPRFRRGRPGSDQQDGFDSPDVNDPGYRNINVSTSLVTAYTESLRGSSAAAPTSSWSKRSSTR